MHFNSGRKNFHFQASEKASVIKIATHIVLCFASIFFFWGICNILLMNLVILSLTDFTRAS